MENDYSLANDLANSNVIKAKCVEDRYAQNLYAAMCNVEWGRIELFEIIKGQSWMCSWRSSGGIVADLRGEGDYLDWYCSGMGEGLGNGDPDNTKGYVSEGTVTDEIQQDLKSLGWRIVELL